MGKNYNNYSKKEKEEVKQENVKEEVVKTVEIEDGPVPTEESVEQEEVKEVFESVEPVEAKPATIEVPPSYGTVFNCERLNIRKGPDKKEEVLCIVNKGSKLTINDKDTIDWFNVTTEDGVEGFCMKKFVDLII